MSFKDYSQKIYFIGIIRERPFDFYGGRGGGGGGWEGWKIKKIPGPNVAGNNI